MLGKAEINDESARILVVGRDWGAEEEKTGHPFSPKPYGMKAGTLLNMCLAQAGLSRKEINVTNVLNKKPAGNKFGAHARGDVEEGLRELRRCVRSSKPNLIVTLGNEASYALVDRWPARGDSILTANGIEDRRGYIWQSRDEFGAVKVLSTIHPAAALRQWIPWTTLLTRDLERAKNESEFAEIRRPKRRVHIVSSDADTIRCVATLKDYPRISFDLEIGGDQRILCCGFCGEASKSFVFPILYLGAIRGLLERPWPRKLAANGQFDLYVLKTQEGIEVKGYRDDTQVAWHSCYPQLAGSGDPTQIISKKKGTTKITKKGVSFLASLFTTDAWWKDYDTDEMGMYELCGRDCCIEFDIMEHLDKLLGTLDVVPIYRHSMSLIEPSVDVQERGILVDEPLRLDRLKKLSDRVGEIGSSINELVQPLLLKNEDHERFRLFESRWTCPCCRNGANKRAQCWSCAGFDSSPGKSALAKQFASTINDGLLLATKSELMAKYLAPCKRCNGDGQRVDVVFNPNSHEQVKILLYEFLKLPPRYSDGKLSGTTEKIRSLLPYT